MKPRGTACAIQTVAGEEARIDRQRDELAPDDMPDGVRHSRPRCGRSPRLKALGRADGRSACEAACATLPASCGLRRIAASAGDSVSDMKAEMKVDTAMVSANCR